MTRRLFSLRRFQTDENTTLFSQRGKVICVYILLGQSSPSARLSRARAVRAARCRRNAPRRLSIMFELILIGMRFAGTILYAFLNGDDL